MSYNGSKAQAGRGSKIEIGPASSTSPVAITGSTTSSSTSVTSVSPTTGYSNGAAITGAGIPVGTTIASGAGTSTLVLSQAATATASGVSLAVGPTYVSIGEIKKAGLGKAQFDKEDVSNFDSALDKEYAKLMRDNGTPNFTGNRVSSDAGQLAAVAAFNDGDNAYLFRLTIRKRPDQSVVGDVYTFSALVMGADFADLEVNKSTPWSVDLQITGPVTFTAGS